ncbi:MAG: 16S rRNA (cytidine(1402)-2'-O)-methyltransferase [Oscillospiraceae bacterium]|nr:16S rRNA (cytidine(1402)-2'-O)-methyltransferase [Oscillospiraceae bacterium]
MSEALLYIVATPIGNLEDLSPRAAAVLASVDFIAAEDTRVTLKLLNHLGIKKPLVSCYRHNEEGRSEGIVARILAGESCALCCDAGTPALSDPGEKLVRLAAQSGVRVIPIPGCCAAAAALSASGLPSGRFCFEGFLPMAKRNRAARLEELATERRTLVFYEAPHKLKNTLKDLYKHLGEREIVLARELTKLHEEIERSSLSTALAEYETREPRGEYVLIVAGREDEAPKQAPQGDPLKRVSELKAAGLSLSEACRRAAAEFGLKKSELYREAARKAPEQPEEG